MFKLEQDLEMFPDDEELLSVKADKFLEKGDKDAALLADKIISTYIKADSLQGSKNSALTLTVSGSSYEILKIIENHKLDVIGAQELKENQVAHLREALGPKGYEIVGRGRLAEGKSEGVYILYNARRFECTASDTFQLSETPEVWGSSSWNSAYPRTCVWVQLKDR